MDQRKIGMFLAQCRKERGITQTVLAEKLGVTQRSISRWETGRNMPDLSLLQPLAAELQVSVSELLDGEKHEKERETEDVIHQVIAYSAGLERRRIFTVGDVNLLTGVLAGVAGILLVIGSAAEAETIPLMLLLLAGGVGVVRLLFGRCPNCGKGLPFSIRALQSCPFCGKKLS